MAAAAERKACDILAARDIRYFYFRVSHSATVNLAAGQYVEKIVTFTAGFRCIARCWPHYVVEGEQGWIKLTLVISSTSQQRVQAPKGAAAHIELRTRNGLPARKVKQEPVLASGDCVGGVSLFATRDEVEKDCVVDDHFTTICSVAMLRDWPPLALPFTHNVGSVIFNMPDLSDVSFQVGEETFKAHRLILAACSPVFRAELFGHMIESTASSITIKDMRPPTFRYMLYYMYHSMLPPAALGMDDASEMAELQHLFIAADRYGLDKLKETCEEIMCASIKTSTVLSALEFAEQNTRPKLKSKCLDFLAVPENFQEVAATDEYLRLMNILPSLLAEVRNCCKRARLV